MALKKNNIFLSNAGKYRRRIRCNTSKETYILKRFLENLVNNFQNVNFEVSKINIYHFL